MRRATGPALVLLLSAWAIAPLFAAPFFASDDGLFHLYRLAALDDALRHGELYPRLFPDFAFGYGQAVFAYYGPLAYYIAEVFRLLGGSFADAIKWTFALGYAGSGLALYLLARRYVPAAPALVGAVAYVYFPYHIAETYQRGALAEHLAFVFLPLLLIPIGGRGLLFVASLAGLILTHSLTAMIFLPFALVWHWFASGNRGRLALCSALALLLTAFYWLPVAAQSRWVGLSAGLAHAGYLAHLAPLAQFVQPSVAFAYAPQQIVSADHPISPLSAGLLLLALGSALRGWRARQSDAPLRVLCALLALGALAMATAPAEPLWRLLHNPLAFLQYPWRFLTPAALGIALGAAFALDGSRSSLLSGLGLQAALLASVPLLIWSAVSALPMKPLAAPAADSAAMWQTDFQNRQIGATWTAEYVPWWVQADRTAIPAAARAPGSAVNAPAPDVRMVSAGYSSQTLRVTNAQSVPLRVHQFYLPQWRASLDGQPLTVYPSGELGLLTVDIPPVQNGTLALEFGRSALEWAGLIASAIAGAWLLWSARGKWLALPVAVALIAAWLVWQAGAAPTVRPSEARIEVIDAERSTPFAALLAVQTDRAAYLPGDSAHLTLYWLAQRRTSENYKSFVHLLAADGRVLAQSDGDPVGGYTPTTRWLPGEFIAETRTLAIPAGASSGTLALVAGMYRFETLENLPAARGGVSLPQGRIPIGEITVGAR